MTKALSKNAVAAPSISEMAAIMAVTEHPSVILARAAPYAAYNARSSSHSKLASHNLVVTGDDTKPADHSTCEAPHADAVLEALLVRAASVDLDRRHNLKANRKTGAPARVATALGEACVAGRIVAVKALLRAGAGPDAPADGRDRTALALAATAGARSATRWARPTATSPNGSPSCISCAACIQPLVPHAAPAGLARGVGVGPEARPPLVSPHALAGPSTASWATRVAPSGATAPSSAVTAAGVSSAMAGVLAQSTMGTAAESADSCPAAAPASCLPARLMW